MLSSRTYTWDVDERLLEVKDALNGATVYSHDALGNLDSAQYENGWIEHRLPDAVGNLFKKNDRSDRKYGPAGRLLESTDNRGTTYFEYDAEGNLVKKTAPESKIWRYEWNDTGMLVKVVRPDGNEVTFAYDALGRRISKKYKDKTTHWVWDGNNPLHEWCTQDPIPVEHHQKIAGSLKQADDIAKKVRTNQLTAQFTSTLPPPETEGTEETPITWLFEPDSFAPMIKILGRNYWSIVTDHLGTPKMMLDETGKKVWSADISVYGKLRNLEPGQKKSACPFRWPGQYEDEETGLYYNRYRYYDPDASQYISQDPIRLTGGMNLYGYVNDPTHFLDPLGLKKCNIDKDTVDALKKTKPDDMINPHMHHIVMEGAFSHWKPENRKLVEDARQILDDMGIKLQGSDNVIWAQNAGHSVEYAKKVLEELTSAKPGGPAKVVEKLGDIAEKLGKGTFLD